MSKKKTPQTLEINRISKSTSIVGDINTDSDLRVDGNIEGSITTSSRIILGKDAKVKGTIICENAEIEGAFSGNLTVKNLLTLKSTASISGEVITGKLAVEPGANFNASCKMKGAVKELNNTEQPRAEKTA